MDEQRAATQTQTQKGSKQSVEPRTDSLRGIQKH